METQQEVYHLLGWSLGGQISLEIACLLEQRGVKKIKIYLLDTMLVVNDSLSLANAIDSDYIPKYQNLMKD
jgi:thioesterase domain-containing protein